MNTQLSMIHKIMDLSTADLESRAALIAAQIEALGFGTKDGAARQVLQRSLAQVQTAQILQRIMALR